MKKILLCVSGGIATYKSLELVRLFKEQNDEVKVVMSQAATEFVTPLSFQSLSHNLVSTQLFNLTDEHEISHIALAQSYDAIIVAPATANCIAKLANGICDDLISTILMASNKPIWLAPAMNTEMWNNEATQMNIQKLQNRQIKIIDPIDGLLACGTYGIGKMSAPETLFQTVNEHFLINQEIKQKLKNKIVVVTAGATKEYIDPIRYITNASSGKMGFSFVEVLKQYDTTVHLITGTTSLPLPHCDTVHQVNSVDEMYQITIDLFKDADILIKTAAPGDFKPKTKKQQKIKKDNQTLALELEKTTDILFELGKKKKENQMLIGFAAETENIIANAMKKLEKKNLDYIVVNEINKNNLAFGKNENSVVLLNQKKQIAFKNQNKKQLAQKIIEEIFS